MGKGNVTVMSEKTNAFSVLFGNHEKERDRLEDIGIGKYNIKIGL